MLLEFNFFMGNGETKGFPQERGRDSNYCATCFHMVTSRSLGLPCANIAPNEGVCSDYKHVWEIIFAGSPLELDSLEGCFGRHSLEPLLAK